MAKDDKKNLSVTVDISGTISYDCHLWYTCVNDNISRSFFHFFKILIFWIVRRVKGQKITQNDKKILSVIMIYQKPYIMIVICGTSSGIFYFFKILIFWVVRRVKGQKKWPKMTKTLSFGLYISGTIHHMTLICGAHM